MTTRGRPRTAATSSDPTPEVPAVMAWGATASAADIPHEFADHVSLVTCQCGAMFQGDHEAEAMARWAVHCEECEVGT
jgi:hypothetical protein